MYVDKQWEINLLELLLLYNADETVLSGLCQKSAVTHRVYLLQCKASSFSQLCLVALCNILHYVVWTCSPALAESIAKSDCHAVRQRENMTEEWNPIFLKLRKTQANEQKKNLLLDCGQNFETQDMICPIVLGEYCCNAEFQHIHSHEKTWSCCPCNGHTHILTMNTIQTS